MDTGRLRRICERWIADDLDPATQRELLALLAQPDLEATDIADRFSGRLEFGTAGLRGIMGAGPNRMNRAVVVRATWGLARALIASIPDAAERGVVVGCDARAMSPQFAEDAAATLGGAGIRVVLFSEPVPTPLVGFAVEQFEAVAGVVITASHNPREYNGYKVYWENAAQIVPPVDALIAQAIDRAPAARDIERPALASLRASGRLIETPAELTRSYLDAVRGLAVRPGEGDRTFPIVYTPLHGVGDALARQALQEAGFSAVTSVPAQRQPDAAFPTVAFPNPEEPGTLDLALALAAELGAALVLANDPDADRLAAAVLHEGKIIQLTGNQLGVLLGHYLLTERPAPPHPGDRKRAVLASIVSTPLVGRMAADLGVHYEETLTGFKWIANRAVELDREGYEFVFGFEEALGYCVGNVAHDKDGISTATLVAEMVAVLRARGHTLVDELDAIGRRWGAFASAQVSVTRMGADGLAKLDAMMDALRASPPKDVAGDELVAIADYQARRRTDIRAGAMAPLALPASNVLAFELESGSRIMARPSGTEPKAKLYFDVCERVRPGEKASDARARAEACARGLALAFQALVGAESLPPA